MADHEEDMKFEPDHRITLGYARQDDSASKRRKHMAVMDDKRDLIPRAEADAWVAAALRLAADVARRKELYARSDLKEVTAAFILRNLVSVTQSRAAHEIEDTILSLTPADAAAALDEVRREAYRAARQLAGLLSPGEGPDIDPNSEKGLSAYDQGWMDAIAHAQKQIAALEEPK